MGESPPHQLVTLVLHCIECRARSDEGRGWKAYLYEEGHEVLVYCPSCARREFEDE